MAPTVVEKIKILRAVLELPAKQQHCQSIYLEKRPNGLNWQCCLAGSSKTTPRILIFFNCHGCQTFILAEIHSYLSALKSWHDIYFLSGVEWNFVSRIGLTYCKKKVEKYFFIRLSLISHLKLGIIWENMVFQKMDITMFFATTLVTLVLGKRYVCAKRLAGSVS